MSTDAAPSPAGGRKNTVAPSRIIKLEAAAKSGNAEVDEMACTSFACLNSCVDDLMAYPELTRSVFNFIREEKKSIERRRQVGGGSVPMFASQSSILGLEEDFKISFVTANSDLDASDVVKVMRDDPGNLDDLVQYAVQMPMKPKLPLSFMVKACLETCWNARTKALDFPLKQFKKNGGLLDSGRLRFYDKTGCYQLEFKGETLVGIKHRSGETVKVPPKSGLGTGHQLRNNHDDWGACLVMPPMPEIKLCSFFCAKGKKGPFQVVNFNGKARDLQTWAEEIHSEWQGRQAALKGTTISAEVQATINEHRAKRRSEAMDKARTAASKALAKKKARRVVDLDVVVAKNASS